MNEKFETNKSDKNKLKCKEYRQHKKDKGLKLFRVWIPFEYEKEFQDLAEKINKE